ncbi:MAG TPA: hypothetical protein VF281_04670 [Candidatus Saccharimonadales bacterium]
MSDETLDPENAEVVLQISSCILRFLTGSNFYLATITGKSLEGRGFVVDVGGFGLLQYLIRDQNVIYSPSSYTQLDTRRHACNIWFHNDELEARVDRWVIDVFNQESEEGLTLLRDHLVEQTEGQIEFRLNCRRGPVRPEKTLADYGLGIRK